jgi:uncharacterized membrane protein YdcZ (DUF606 family)
VQFWSKKQPNLAFAPALFFLIALIAGVGLRVWALAGVPLNFDEAASVYIARMPIAEVLEKNGPFNSSPPAMLLLLHFVLKIGDSEEFVRALSVLSGIVTIAVVYLITKHLHPNPYYPALASLLFALSAQQIMLSRQFRVYALGEMFGALGLMAALAFARRPSWRSAGVAGLLFFIGIQVQYALTPFFASTGIALACGRYDVPAPWKKRLGHLALIAGIAAIGIALMYQTALKYQLYPGRGTSYSSTLVSSSPPSLLVILLLFLVRSWDLIKSGLDLEAVPWSGDVLTAFCVIGMIRLAKRYGRDPYLIATFCSMLIFAILSGLNYYPYGPVRQCLVLTLPLYGLAALGIVEEVSSPSKFRRGIAVAILALLPVAFAGGLAFKWTSGAGNSNRTEIGQKTSDFREGMRALQARWEPGDVIFVPPGSFPIYQYYSRQYTPRPWIAAQGSMEWMQDERAWRGMIQSEPPYGTQLDALMRSHDRVWLLYSHYHPHEVTFPALAARRGWMDRVETIMKGRAAEFGEGNELYLFRR